MSELVLIAAVVIATGSMVAAWYWHRETLRLRRGVAEIIREASHGRRAS